MGMDYQEVMLMKEQALNKQRQDAIREQSYRQKAIDEQVERNAIWNKLASLNEDDGSFLDFKKKVTDSFVVEGLTVFVDNCINPAIIREESNQRLVRQMVSEFVKEEGSTNLLNRMKRTSYVMSELAYVTEKTIQSVLEAVDKNNTETFKIEDNVKNKYYDELSKLDVDDAVNKIKENVLKQTEEFKTENMKTKLELASTADKTKQKVEQVENKLQDKANSEKAKQEAEKLTEAYIADGKRRAIDIRENRTKTVFEHMVYTLAKTSMVNESANRVFVKDSRLDMDAIVEHCEVLVTFLTAMDSTKLINVDEAYIRNMLEDMKK